MRSSLPEPLFAMHGMKSLNSDKRKYQICLKSPKFLANSGI